MILVIRIRIITIRIKIVSINIASMCMTINIINGGLECGYALEAPPRAAPANVQDRLRFYTYFTMRLGVPEGDAVDCGSMRHY